MPAFKQEKEAIFLYDLSDLAYGGFDFMSFSITFIWPHYDILINSFEITPREALCTAFIRSNRVN